MGGVVEVKHGRYLSKLLEDLVVARHVRCQDAPDDALAQVPELLGGKFFKHIALWSAQDSKCH
jgi:hypothetical protein